MGNDDWLSHLSDEIQLKCETPPPPKSSNEKLIFILHLNFWWLAKLSKQQKSTEML